MDRWKSTRTTYVFNIWTWIIKVLLKNKHRRRWNQMRRCIANHQEIQDSFQLQYFGQDMPCGIYTIASKQLMYRINDWSGHKSIKSWKKAIRSRVERTVRPTWRAWIPRDCRWGNMGAAHNEKVTNPEGWQPSRAYRTIQKNGMASYRSQPQTQP